MSASGWYTAVIKEMPDLLDSEKQILRALLVEEETIDNKTDRGPREIKECVD